MPSRSMFRMTAAGFALLTTLLTVGCGTTQTNNTASSNATSNTTSSGAGNAAANATPDASGQATSQPQQWTSAPAMQIDVNKSYSAVVHTNYGDFTIHLFAKDSPLTVNNFVFLANHHFYNNDKFFRIIKTFMVQTGDPLNTGTGGPGYQFADELPPKHPYDQQHYYGPGIVAMANAGPNTNGSQFFICTGADSEGLPPSYTEFGQVTKGMNVVEAIAAIPVVQNPNSGEVSYPTKDAVIQSVDIVTN